MRSQIEFRVLAHARRIDLDVDLCDFLVGEHFRCFIITVSWKNGAATSIRPKLSIGHCVVRFCYNVLAGDFAVQVRYACFVTTARARNATVVEE
jgi:hypothetical protein